MTLKDDDDEAARGPSRAEIEALCILHAIGPTGCATRDIAVRLGFSERLAGVVAGEALRLVGEGLVNVADGRVSLTEGGAQQLRERLPNLLARSRS